MFSNFGIFQVEMENAFIFSGKKESLSPSYRHEHIADKYP